MFPVAVDIDPQPGKIVHGISGNDAVMGAVLEIDSFLSSSINGMVRYLEIRGVGDRDVLLGTADDLLVTGAGVYYCVSVDNEMFIAPGRIDGARPGIASLGGHVVRNRLGRRGRPPEILNPLYC